MASDCRDRCCRVDHILGRNMSGPLSVSGQVLLLRLFLVPQVLWKLLWLLRPAERITAQAPGRPLPQRASYATLPRAGPHDSRTDCTHIHDHCLCRTSTYQVRRVRRQQEELRKR